MPAEVNDSIRMLEKNIPEHINSSIKTHFEMFHEITEMIAIDKRQTN